MDSDDFGSKSRKRSALTSPLTNTHSEPSVPACVCVCFYVTQSNQGPSCSLTVISGPRTVSK